MTMAFSAAACRRCSCHHITMPHIILIFIGGLKLSGHGYFQSHDLGNTSGWLT